MSFAHLVLGATVVAVLCIVGGIWRAGRRRQERRCRVTQAFRDAAPGQRGEAMRAFLTAGDVQAIAWYLSGAICLREGRAREAARAFGMAHHADWRLQTAALLTFAALKASEGETGDLIEQIVQTWREAKEPDVFGTAEDRDVVECLTATTAQPPRDLSALGRLAWAVIGPAQQERMSRILAEQPPWARPLREKGSG